MSSTNTTEKSSGAGFATLLGLLFIGLKLGHVIHWSWLWVLVPLWGPVAFVIVLAVIAFIVAAVVESGSE